MRPHIENITHERNFNWRVREFACLIPKDEYMCAWHYHSEFELVLYRDQNNIFDGNYFAGDYVGSVLHNTMLLYGPGLPHMFTGKIARSEEKHHQSIILWFTRDWIEQLQKTTPELKILSTLLRRSSKGLLFSSQCAEKVFQLLSNSDRLPAHHQLLRVLEVLTLLADDALAEELSSSSYAFNQSADEDEQHKRVEAARRYIESNYQNQIKICDLCKTLHMSESSAYRLFEKHFCESFSEHLKSYRIGKACELLVNTQIPVALVAEQAGFNNLSNFNRQFRTLKGITPSVFRSQFNR